MKNQPRSPRPRASALGASIAVGGAVFVGMTALLTQSCTSSSEAPAVKEPTTSEAVQTAAPTAGVPASAAPTVTAPPTPPTLPPPPT